MSTMTLAERRETLVNSLRASKSWTTGYAEAFVDDYVISTQPAQAVDVCDLCHELYAMAQGQQPISDAITAMELRLTRAINVKA